MHELTLETDEYGNVLQSAKVSYPRNGDSVSFGEISAALSGIDINDEEELKETMDGLLDMDETAGMYYHWLERLHLIAPEVFFTTGGGGVQFADAAQYQIGTGDFSIESWIKTSLSGGTVFAYDSAFSGWSGSGGVWPGGIDLFFSDGKLYLFISDGINQYKQLGTANVVIPTNQWTHLVVTRGAPADTGEWKIYVNGAAVSVAFSGGGMTGGDFNAGTGDVLNIGRRSNYTPDYLSGSVKTSRWYNRELSAGDAETLYNDGIGRKALAGSVFDMGLSMQAGKAIDVSKYKVEEGILSGAATIRYGLTGLTAGSALKGTLLALADTQRTMLVTGTETGYTGDAIGDPEWYRLRQPCDVRTYQLHAFSEPTGFWLPANLKTVLDGTTETDFYTTVFPAARKRLISRQQFTFYNNAATAELSPGVLEALSVPYTTRHLAYTYDLWTGVYDTRAGQTSFTGTGGYELEYPVVDEPEIWMKGGTIQYDNPAGSFYTPVGFTDPWDNLTVVSYWGDYFLLPEFVIDAKSSMTVVDAYDWRCLQPTTITDANDNKTEVIYDMLGMPAALAMKGRAGDTLPADELGSIDPDADSSSFWSDPYAYDGTFLGHATWRCLYDLNSTGPGDPVRVAMIAREQHYVTPAVSNINQIRITYTDGFGRVAMHKAQTDPDGLTPRWISSGKTVYNNKGNVVMQFEPYFSLSHNYDAAEQAAAGGVSPKIFYDPLGRAQRTNLPDGSFTKTEWDAWKQTVYDNNDTVLDSDWYDLYANADNTSHPGVYVHMNDAAAKAAVHHNTPTVMHLDTLARPFYTIQHNKIKAGGVWVDEFYNSYAGLDIAGNRLSITDARNITTLSYIYNMVQVPIRQLSADSGLQHTIVAADGQPHYAWDADEREFTFEYDALRRTVKKSVTGSATTKVLEVMVYGEDAGSPASHNLRGRLYRHYDGAGKVEIPDYDYKGNPLTTVRQFTDAATQLLHPDWTTIGSVAMEVDGSSAPVLYTSSTVYDALSRPWNVYTPDGGDVSYEYNRQGLLSNVSANARNFSDEVITHIAYNAKSQPLNILRPMIGAESYEYDPYTFRVTRIHTGTRQDLNYYYDPVGNIIFMRDDAQQDTYFDNTVVSANNGYTYDALYRLIEATGRELRATNASPDYNDSARTAKSPVPFVNSTTLTDTTALRNYTQKYYYDEVGNMTVMKHLVGGTDNWTREFTIDNDTNRLLDNSIGSNSTTSETYTYDARGNIAGGFNHLLGMDYNAANRLEHIEHTATTDSYYQYDGNGQRVRKITLNSTGSIKEVRVYIGDYELYTKHTGSTLNIKRETRHITDDSRRLMLLDTEFDNTNPTVVDETIARHQLTNHLGSTSLEINDSGDVISYEEYYPYGGTSFQTTNGAISQKRYRYTGKERDEESGFYYHGARYYVPWLARWCAVDPINNENYNLNKGQPNRNKKRDYFELCASSYEYSYDNPVRFFDDNGEQPRVEKRHFDFYSKTGVEIYDIARGKGFSPFAALVVLAQGATESGYGTSKASSLNNFFGIMGGSSNVKTTHGTLREFGSSKEGINFYFNKLEQKWPTTVDLYKRYSFTANEFNKALNSGPFEKYPAYFVKDKGHNYDYGENILNQVLPNSTARFLIVLAQLSGRLEEQKADLSKQLATAKDALTKLSPENAKEMTVLNQKVMSLNQQVQSIDKQIQKLNTTINEVKKVRVK